MYENLFPEQQRRTKKYDDVLFGLPPMMGGIPNDSRDRRKSDVDETEEN